MRARLVTLVFVATAGNAAAQQSPGFPQYGTNPYAYGPTNPYNRTTQPLSPYLNLLRGGNPAVNYAYGVRPGTTGAGGGFGGAPMFSAGAQRGSFFPQQQLAQQDTVDLPMPSEGYKLPPAGHPVLFNNTLGYFPSPFGQRGGAGRPGQTGQTGTSGGTRPTGGTGGSGGTGGATRRP